MSDDPRFLATERRQADTRVALIDAALEEFQAGGIPTISSVCETVGITRPRLYRIWNEGADEMYRDIAATCIKGGDSDSVGGARAILMGLLSGLTAETVGWEKEVNVVTAVMTLYAGGAASPE